MLESRKHPSVSCLSVCIISSWLEWHASGIRNVMKYAIVFDVHSDDEGRRTVRVCGRREGD